MKKLLLLLTIIFSGLVLASCQDSKLEEIKPEDLSSVKSEIIKANKYLADRSATADVKKGDVVSFSMDASFSADITTPNDGSAKIAFSAKLGANVLKSNGFLEITNDVITKNLNHKLSIADGNSKLSVVVDDKIYISTKINALPEANFSTKIPSVTDAAYLVQARLGKEKIPSVPENLDQTLSPMFLLNAILNMEGLKFEKSSSKTVITYATDLGKLSKFAGLADMLGDVEVADSLSKVISESKLPVKLVVELDKNYLLKKISFDLKGEFEYKLNSDDATKAKLVLDIKFNMTSGTKEVSLPTINKEGYLNLDLNTLVTKIIPALIPSNLIPHNNN